MLTDSKIRNAEPQAKRFKLLDSRGLYLVVNPEGSKSWSFRYKFGGADKTFGLGQYPIVSLKAAREARDEQLQVLRHGDDPSAERHARKEAAAVADATVLTFESVARVCYELISTKKSAASKNRDYRIHKEVYQRIGSTPIAAVDRLAINSAVQAIAKIKNRHETAARAFGFINRVFEYAVDNQLVEENPTPRKSANVLGPGPPEKHFAAVTDPKEFGKLLRAIAEYDGKPGTILALKVLPLVFTRPAELRFAKWKEFDLDSDEPQWVIPKARIKTRVSDHIVPLSKQVVEILREAKLWRDGSGKPEESYVFPSTRTGRPISENTLRIALGTAGYTGDVHTAHGFRSTASTLLHAKGFDSDVIELQLAHKDDDEVRAVYNRSQRLPERRALLQAWADYVDQLRDGAKVIKFPAKNK